MSLEKKSEISHKILKSSSQKTNPKKVPKNKNSNIIILKNISIADIIKIHFNVNSACEIINNTIRSLEPQLNKYSSTKIKKPNFELVGFDESSNNPNNI